MGPGTVEERQREANLMHHREHALLLREAGLPLVLGELVVDEVPIEWDERLDDRRLGFPEYLVQRGELRRGSFRQPVPCPRRAVVLAPGDGIQNRGLRLV